MRKNNKGFSLVELIVVLAILSVMTVVVVNNFSYLKYANTKSCATRLNAIVERARALAMSKEGQPDLILYNYNDSLYYKVSNNVSEPLDDSGMKLGNEQIVVTYKDTKDTIYSLSSGDSVRISFKKNTGGLKELAADTYLEEIIIKAKDSSNQYRIVIVAITGKHYVEEF